MHIAPSSAAIRGRPAIARSGPGRSRSSDADRPDLAVPLDRAALAPDRRRGAEADELAGGDLLDELGVAVLDCRIVETGDDERAVELEGRGVIGKGDVE